MAAVTSTKREITFNVELSEEEVQHLAALLRAANAPHTVLSSLETELCNILDRGTTHYSYNETTGYFEEDTP